MKHDEIEVMKIYKGFTPVNHTPLRNMKDLNAIGMLTYLISHTKDFKVTKGGLYSRFGRGIAERSLKRLENEGFFLSFKLREGSRVAYRYFASDIPFTEAQVLAIAARLVVDEGFIRVDELPGRFSYLFSKEESSYAEAAFTAAKERHMQEAAEKQQESSAVENEQRTVNSADSAEQNKQVKKTKDLKKISSKKNKLSKTTSSSPVTKSREAVKQDLVNEFGHEHVEKVEAALLVDKSVSIKTDKQYNALMRYRLNLAKTEKRNKVSNGGALPKWYDNEKKQQRLHYEKQKQELEKESESITDDDIKAMLESLGVPIAVGA